MTSNERLEHYIKYALVPTMGAVTASLSAGGSDVPTGFYHYGGPAITVDRTNLVNATAIMKTDSNVISASGSFSYGTHVFETDGGLEVFRAFNAQANDVFIRQNKLGPDGPTGDTIFNNTNGREAGFEAFGDGKFGTQLLQSGEQVNLKSSKGSNEPGIVAATKTETNGKNGEAKGQLSTSFGDWRTSDGEEVRGIIGATNGDAEGWVDVGWDNGSLVIYDWAVNFDGQIVAGQTEAAAAVPGAGGIAALAMGAAGLRRRRKRSA